MEIKPTLMTTQILMRVINEKPEVFAYVTGKDIEGTVCFYCYKSGSIMIYEIKGLPKGEKNKDGIFGFHIHEGNSCNPQNDYEKTKGHFNPYQTEHPYHLGDLPPLFATNGTAWGIIYIDKFSPNEIVNRTMVIHAHPDDFHTQPSGNSGMKIACGEIKFFKK